MKELVVLLKLTCPCKYTVVLILTLSEIMSEPAVGRGAGPCGGAPAVLLSCEWIVLQWLGSPHGGIPSWSVVSVPFPRAGVGHLGLLLLTLFHHRVLQGKKFLRHQWPMEKNTLVIYLQNDIVEQLNQTLIGVFMDCSVTVTKLDRGCVGAREGMDWGCTFSWQESATDQMCVNEGVLMTQTIWEGRACVVVVYQVIALQTECQHTEIILSWI